MLLLLVAARSDDSSPVNGGNDGNGDNTCINYTSFLHYAGSVDIPDLAYGVVVSGNYAYVADGDSGLQVAPIQCSSGP
jgi:hypothetical protein